MFADFLQMLTFSLPFVSPRRALCLSHFPQHSVVFVFLLSVVFLLLLSLSVCSVFYMSFIMFFMSLWDFTVVSMSHSVLHRFVLLLLLLLLHHLFVLLPPSSFPSSTLWSWSYLRFLAMIFCWFYSWPSLFTVHHLLFLLLRLFLKHPLCISFSSFSFPPLSFFCNSANYFIFPIPLYSLLL